MSDEIQKQEFVSIHFDKNNNIIDDSPQAHYLITGKKKKDE